MQIDVVRILYLFLRLSPFIIVCYFTLLSVFNQDLKGVIYLFGLLLTCAIVGSLGDWIASIQDIEETTITNKICHLTYLGIENESQPAKLFKYVPLGVVTLWYTFMYIFTIIWSNDLWDLNIPFLVLFPLLLIGDGVWGFMNQCLSIEGYGLAIIGGIIFGFMWAVIIESFQVADLTLFNGISNKEVCERPSRQRYRCRIMKKSAATS